LITALFFAFAASLPAQVANYNFSQSPGTYTAITGGTLLFNSSFDDAVSGPITVPAFMYDGGTYTQIWVSTNGFLTFGSAPAANNYTPLSSTATYAGAVSPFGANLASGASGATNIRFRSVGFQLIVQWTNVRRVGQTESFSFQANLNRYTGVIKFIYGPITSGPSASVLQQPEVGLRGPDNNFANNVHNRRTDPGNHDWDNSTPGNTNDSKMRFTSSAPAKFWAPGQTYRYRRPAGGMGCEPPYLIMSVNSDCSTNTFTITSNVETIGDASNVTVSTIPAGGIYANVDSGIYVTGPYAFGTIVTLNVVNNSDANCGEQVTNVTNAVCDCLGASDGTALPGTACDDANACTTGDTWSNGCVCTGALLDADNDGVCDLTDACPGTPAAQGVNATGCSCSQVTVSDGNPCTLDVCTNGTVTHTFQDADADGVCDATDTCPGTATGQGVNTSGCSCAQVTVSDGNPCTLDVCTNGTVTHTFQDADGDGVCDANDTCPGTAAGQGVNTTGCSCAQVTVSDGNPCTLDVCTNGNVTHTFQDADTDGVCDANDTCPGTIAGQGVNTSGCSCAQVTVDDGIPCTLDQCTNGVVTHTLQDADGDGVCDANDTCPGTASGDGVNAQGCSCAQVTVDDNNPCTLDQCTNGIVSNTFQDADGDGVCDANDTCPGTATGVGVNTSGCSCAQVTVNDGDVCTLDACTNGIVTNTFQDADGDGICDANDTCPDLVGGVGDTCDDGNANTAGDAIDGTCTCTGEACTTTLNIVFQTDGISNVAWEIREQGTNQLMRSGGGLYPESLGYGEITCLPDGCFYLVVTDDGGDGIAGGGYILSVSGGQRLIDNRNNFTTGFISQIAGGEGFCLPMGLDQLIYVSTDKLDWVNGEYIVATPNISVSAQWSAGNGPNEATSGYEFWFFDPNGTYSYRRFHSHSTSDDFGPDSPSRACHVKINNWLLANQIPSNKLMNVRVRGRVAGVNKEWGPASRFKIDPVRAACPLTKLMDIPSQPFYSCGGTRAFGTGNYVNARPVTGANRYQFRFRIDAENFVTVRNSTTYFVQLNWVVNPLQDGKTYQVEVRASKDNGATWCIDTPIPTPGPNFTTWGDVCDLTIDNTPMGAGDQNLAMEDGSTLKLYPNPNRGEQLYLSLDAIEEGVNTVSVDIFDLLGKRVSARTIPVQGGFINTVLDLDGDMTGGMYLVNITAGGKHYTERLVIQR